MSNFEQALEVVLKHEGGLTDDPNDSGGITNFGLTLEDLADAGLSISTDAIKALTPETAAPIYQKLYWNPMCLDEINDDNIALILFDQCILAGTHTTTKIAQKIVGVITDGVMGPNTVRAINEQESPVIFCNSFLDAMCAHYKDIVDHDPKDAKFLKGWINRVEDLRAMASK